MSATNSASSSSNTIVANNSTHNDRASSRTVVHFPPPTSYGPLSEEDLELRIGIGNVYGGDSSDQTPKQAKTGNASSSEAKAIAKEVEFCCTICMDTMKEESSAKCGHIFCKGCIVKAIRAHGKCPTCKTKMSTGSIRRIYLPGLNP